MRKIISDVAARLEQLGYPRAKAHQTAVILWIFTEKDKRHRLGYLLTSPILVTRTVEKQKV